MTRTLTWVRLFTVAMAFALLAGIAVNQSDLALATSGAHPQSKTPGSNSAVLYTTLGATASDEFRDIAGVLKQHEYDLRFFGIAAPQEKPEGTYFNSGANILKTVLGGKHGVIYIASHGAVNQLLVEVTGHGEDACNNTIKSYVEKNLFKSDELICDQFLEERGQAAWGIWFTDKAIDNYFSDTDTIVHVAACKSFSLADNFARAREYFGYDACIDVNNGQARHDTSLLWGRMDGGTDDGKYRSAGEAYNAGGFTTNPKFQHQHRAGALDTVLSPSVKSHNPGVNEVLTLGQSHAGQIVFDTKMDTTKDPLQVLTVSGCNAQISAATWKSEFVIEFALTVNKLGVGELTIHHDKARSAKRYWTFDLDGNQNPGPGKNHIGPNRDDYVWKILCGLPILEEFYPWGKFEVDRSKMELVDVDSFYINYDQLLTTIGKGDLPLEPIVPIDGNTSIEDGAPQDGAPEDGSPTIIDQGGHKLRPIPPTLTPGVKPFPTDIGAKSDTTTLDQFSLVRQP